MDIFLKISGMHCSAQSLCRSYAWTAACRKLLTAMDFSRAVLGEDVCLLRGFSSLGMEPEYSQI